MHYVRINRIVEKEATRNKQQQDNVRAAELYFMLDLETLIKEPAADPDLIAELLHRGHKFKPKLQRIQSCGQKTHLPLGHYYDGRQDNSARDTSFGRTQCPTLLTSWDQQDV